MTIQLDPATTSAEQSAIRTIGATPRSCVCILVLAFCQLHVAAASATYVSFDFPGAADTFINGISGNSMVGYYRTSSNFQLWRGFVSDGVHNVSLDAPLGVMGTEAFGIAGSKIVGFYTDAANKNHGFVYDGSSYTTIDDPLGVNGTQAYGISGNKIVGTYSDAASKVHGFLYDGSSYTTIDNPAGTTSTQLYGISGSNMVGYYTSPAATRGFTYNGTTFTLLDPTYVKPFGISGSSIVGTFGGTILPFTPPHGFLFDGSAYTTLDVPFALSSVGYGTVAHGVSGSTIVGYYQASTGRVHGFITQVPEPGAFLLAALGLLTGLIVARPRARRR